MHIKHYMKNIQWVDGIKSRNGFTRKECSMNFGEDVILDKIIFDVMDFLECQTVKPIKINLSNLRGIYLNYYRNGNDYTPNHSRKNTHQLIISLGVSRTLNVGKRSFVTKNGDVIFFGSSVHGVPKEQCNEERISIAVFIAR